MGPAVVTELSAAGFTDADEIGRGGFGIVYRCTQTALDRTVAVKVLTAGLDDNRERFLREQRAMGRLTGHPNIVGVLQVGETASGYPYLVMQYHPQGSLEARIRRLGARPLDEVLRLGVKIAGALESAHRLGVVHRDVKPANILLTDYGEPALSDFGIAHISGGFTTAAGTFTGSPAFTAPEILSGDPPSEASDVYGLGATLFAALTGHAAFERRSGEQIVTQFLRIASESAPDLRETGVPDDVATVVEKAMSRNPQDRPSAAELGAELQRLQAQRGLPVDEMARRAGDTTPRPAGATRTLGNLPLELTSFIGRRDELSAVQHMLTSARLVTLTGIGGIGKTRLALRAASEAAADFADGVWLVEFGELRDAGLLVDVVADTLGLREESNQPLIDHLVEHLSARNLLLVLDNCEQVVDTAAGLAERLLRACPGLRIIATSREALGIGGEAVLRVTPLSHGDDAVTLFAERAAAAVPGFAVTDDNKATIATICAKLEGLPLAIELAAARLRAMSLDQVLDRLDDRYALLTRGPRGAPTRQQTLAWSVGWSYDLCTPAEQKLWSRLSVFAGSFELQAAEDICTGYFVPDDVLDLLSALVDKSILIRTETDGMVRFRLLETLRDYGRERVESTAEYTALRRRHADWYRRLVDEAAADWFGPRQVTWMRRLHHEGLNIRAALAFFLEDSPPTALEMASIVHPFAIARGFLTEARHWLDRALAATPPEPSLHRIRAECAAITIAALQGDVAAATERQAAAQALVEQIADPQARGIVDFTDGLIALVAGDFDRAFDRFEKSLPVVDDDFLRVGSMLLIGWALEFGGEISRALIWQEKALAYTKSRGELVFRGYASYSLGIGWWRHGHAERAEELLSDALRITRVVDDPRQGSSNLEGLAWIAWDNGDARRAAVLMGAAQRLARSVGRVPWCCLTCRDSTTTAPARHGKRWAPTSLSRHTLKVP
ncbi:protein kinase domain-containing protein [Mycobacterium hubeiense]|uniref:protein kinase domain-containing protein n=1 Tax=Mycobacterium hubeiense TaxID=1867256 RepID=UPI001E31EA89|nr:protein kinase [Mycobacterium sp. QGD 101]